MALAPAIRRALSIDRAEVVETVTAAFAEDPAWGWLLGDEYERLAPAFVGALFDLRVASGTIWVSDDLATVAMWESPGAGDEHPQRAEQVWERYRAFAGERAHGRLVAYRDGLAISCNTAHLGAYSRRRRSYPHDPPRRRDGRW